MILINFFYYYYIINQMSMLYHRFYLARWSRKFIDEFALFCNDGFLMVVKLFYDIFTPVFMGFTLRLESFTVKNAS